MRKFILMVLLVVASGSAIAEWLRVGATDYFTYYIDKATIIKKAGMAKMWHLHDEKANRKTITRETYRSTKELIEYQCKKNMMRTLAYSLHSNNMGKGDLIYQDNFAGEWVVVPPVSIDATLRKFACGMQ